jgi:acyl-CoA dehydrogenase
MRPAGGLARLVDSVGRQNGRRSDSRDDSLAEAVRRRFGRFLKERVSPGATERDATNTPLSRELLRATAECGLLGLAMPRDVGGGGYALREWGRTLEVVGYECEDLSFPLVLSLYAAVASAVYESGRADLIRRYVRPLVRGERFCSFAYSEERDPFSFESTARFEDGVYVIDGQKSQVTGGMMADAFAVYLRRDKGLDLMVVLVERDDEGVEVLPVATMGVRAAGLATLKLRSVRVPASRVLVEADGLSHVQHFLNQRRLILACGVLGRMRAVIEEVIELLNGSIRFGMPLTEMQSVQAALGRMYVALHTATVVAHDALDHLVAKDFDPMWDSIVSASKYYVVKQAIEVGQSALHLAGGRGYLSSRPLERYVRDVMGLVAGGGAQDILEVDLGVNLVSAWERRSPAMEAPR